MDGPRHADLATPTGKRVSVTIASDAAHGGAFAARRIADLLHAVIGRPPVLGLATGRSVTPIYAALVEAFRRHELDASRIQTFNLDEYLGLDADHPASFRRFMREQLFGPAGIPPESCHFPQARAGGDGAVDIAYEDAIRAAGGIDLQLLGIGVNGHVAFNEPGSARETRTRRVKLAAETLRENSAAFEGLGPMPGEAVTMGIATILETRHVMLVAWGASKAAPLARAFLGPVTSACPASFLQEHPGTVEVIVDGEAASDLAAALP